MNAIVRCFIEIIFLIYADDTTVCVSNVDTVQCISIMNQCSSHVYRWLYMNELSLNVSKPNYVKFNRRKQINLNVLPSVTLCSTRRIRRPRPLGRTLSGIK